MLKILLKFILLITIISILVLLLSRQNSEHTFSLVKSSAQNSLINNYDFEELTNFTKYENTSTQDTAKDDIILVENDKPKLNGTLKVGFSQIEVNNDYQIMQSLSIKKAALKANIDLIYYDLGENTETKLLGEQLLQNQLLQIQDLIKQKVDYLVIVPRQEIGYTGVLNEAKDADIPVILLDGRTKSRSPNSYYLTTIMPDYIKIGSDAALIFEEIFSEKNINILQILGGSSHTSSMLIDKGFRSISSDNNWTITQIDGKKSVNETKKELETLFSNSDVKFDAIFSHRDNSTCATIALMETLGYNFGNDSSDNQIPVVSIGGYDSGISYMNNGKINSIIKTSPFLGELIFHYINELNNGETIPSRIVIPYEIYNQNSDLDDIEGY